MATSRGTAREMEKSPLLMAESGSDPTDLVLAKTKMLSSIASMKKKLREMGSSSTLVTIPELIEDELGDLANKKVLKLLLVGPAGSGKSTLANTLACRYLSHVELGIFTGSVTKDLDSTETKVRIGESENCTFIIYDTPGFTGNEESDARVRAEIEEKIPNPDMVVVCFDITAFGGRRLEFLHGNVIKAMKKVRGGALLDCCAIAITKVNLLASQYEHRLADPKQGTPSEADTQAWHDGVRDAVDQWRVMWKEILSDCELSQEQVAGIPVSIFGQIEFANDKGKTPCDVTPIGPWGRDWLKESWGEVMSVAPDALPLFFILSSHFHATPDIGEGMHQHDPTLLGILWKLIIQAAGRRMLLLLVLGICIIVLLAPMWVGVTIGVIIGGVVALAAVTGRGKMLRGYMAYRRRRGEDVGSSKRWKDDEDQKRSASLKAYYAKYSPTEALAYLEEFEKKIYTIAGRCPQS